MVYSNKDVTYSMYRDVKYFLHLERCTEGCMEHVRYINPFFKILQWTAFRHNL